MQVYKYCIIGGGPTGLALAWYLSKRGSVVLLDEHTNLGGCHRVMRVRGGQFTEHAPRVYSAAYVNAWRWLADMGIDWTQYFVPYKYSLADVQGHPSFSLRELAWLAAAFLIPPTGSVADFAQQHSFRAASLDYMDRVCALTDGAGSRRYPMAKFLELINQQALYTLYQPSQPTDEGLFLDIEHRLVAAGVRVLNNTTALRVPDAHTVQTSRGLVQADTIIAAVPPAALLRLGVPIDRAWVLQTAYRPFIPIVLQYRAGVTLSLGHGFPSSQWAIAFVQPTEYWADPQSGWQLVSAVIGRPVVVSDYTGKAALHTPAAELASEVARQLSLPEPDGYAMPPTLRWVNMEWRDTDSAYMDAVGTEPVPPEATLPLLYTVGTHNGRSSYAFTTMESAVQNAMAFLENESIQSTWTVKQVLGLVLMSALFLFAS